MTKFHKFTAFAASSLALLAMAAASPASAVTFLTDSLGTLTIDPVTQTGSLSASTTLIYKNTGATTSALSFSFVNGLIHSSGTVAGLAKAASDATQIDYTFTIATPVDLLYGQTINTVLGNRVALGAGNIQLWDLTTNTALTPSVNLSLSGITNSASTAAFTVNLTDTTDLYAVRVIGNVPDRPTSTSLINVQYSPSVFATAVPEPASWSLMLLGVGALGATLRRRRTVAATA
jgi:hypothetical protein